MCKCAGARMCVGVRGHICSRSSPAIVSYEMEGVLLPSIGYLKTWKAELQAALDCFYCLLLFCPSSLRWKPPAISHRMRSCWPGFGSSTAHTVVTYRLTFMAQHALVGFLGQDQVARLRSGPDFVTVQTIPVALRLCLVGKAKQDCCEFFSVKWLRENVCTCLWKNRLDIKKLAVLRYVSDIMQQRLSVKTYCTTTDLLHCNWLLH